MRYLLLLVLITVVGAQSSNCSQASSKSTCFQLTSCLWCKLGNGTCLDPSIQLCPAHLLDTPCSVHAEDLKIALIICISAISVILIGVSLLFLYLCLPSPCMVRRYDYR